VCGAVLWGGLANATAEAMAETALNGRQPGSQ
jgi:hypothetical protein